MSSIIDRRQFLARSAGAASGLTVLGAIAGCGKSSTTASATGKSSAGLTTASLQLLWIFNVQFAGSYIAEKRGYYRDAGVGLSLLPGGVTVTPEPVIESGKALVGISSPSLTGAAVNQGADLKIIGASYQRNPDCLISLARKPITTPAEVVGKRIGVQANIATVWDAFVKVNNLHGKFTQVPAQADPAPLAAGEIDGYVGFYTNEANILRVRGVPVHTLLFNDYGLPTLYETYACRSSALQDAKQRKAIKAILTAEIRGWEDQVSNPSLGVKLALDDFGKTLGLNAKQQQLQAQTQNQLMVSSVTKQHGLFWMTPEAIAQSVETLARSQTRVKPDLFDNSLLAEIYNGRNRI